MTAYRRRCQLHEFPHTLIAALEEAPHRVFPTSAPSARHATVLRQLTKAKTAATGSPLPEKNSTSTPPPVNRPPAPPVKLIRIAVWTRLSDLRRPSPKDTGPRTAGRRPSGWVRISGAKISLAGLKFRYVLVTDSTNARCVRSIGIAAVPGRMSSQIVPMAVATAVCDSAVSGRSESTEFDTRRGKR